MDQEALDYVLEKVTDMESYLHFLDVLRHDWYSANEAEEALPSNPYGSMYGWENTDIGSFLEAAIAGARDQLAAGRSEADFGENPWRQAAQILLLGKIYE